MEPRPFNLQSEIVIYLNRLHIKASLSHSDKIELESHIRDSIDDLGKKGLSVEEAFFITIKRMGEVDIISEEYNKVNPFFLPVKIRSYLIPVLGFIIVFGTIFLFVYELISLYRKAYLAETAADAVLRSSLYFGLCIAILVALKKGSSLSAILQNNIHRRPMATMSFLFLLPLFNFFLQPVIIRLFDTKGQEDNFNYKIYAGTDIQFINLSFYLLILSILFLALVSLGITADKKRKSAKTSFLERPVIFLIFFGMLISAAAVMIRYIPGSNSALQNSLILAITYVMGSFLIAFHNNDNLWPKLFIFSAFGFGLGNLLG